jgi:hypothetical protein
MTAVAASASPDRMAVVSPARGRRLAESFRRHGVWAPGVRLFHATGLRATALIVSAVSLPIIDSLRLRQRRASVTSAVRPLP